MSFKKASKIDGNSLSQEEKAVILAYREQKERHGITSHAILSTIPTMIAQYGDPDALSCRDIKNALWYNAVLCEFHANVLEYSTPD